MTVTAKKVKAPKLSPQELDKLVLEYMAKDRVVKRANARLAEIKKIIEGQYSKKAQTKEVLKGIVTEVTKIPVNNGRNKYNAEKLRPFLKAIRKLNSIIKVQKTYTIDVPALNKLEKDGDLTKEILDTCREDSWTFKSDFKRIVK